MKITKLFTGEDNKSYFEEMDCGHDSVEALGLYSQKYPTTGIMFRDFEAGLVFDMHTAPQPQYIIYLEGEVEVETSSGDKRIFKSGDVLLATDTTGEGHISRMLTQGRSVIVTTK